MVVKKKRMQIEDPDKNLLILHSYLTLYCDPYGKTLNETYQLELAKSLLNQLEAKNLTTKQACTNTSINFEKKPNANLGPCDLSINLNTILSKIDVSSAPYLQEVQIEKVIQEQVENYPKTQGWCKYLSTLTKPAISLSLHAVDLNILHAQIEFENGTIVQCTNLSYLPHREMVSFWFEKEIPAQTPFSFIIQFQFYLKSHWYGMYLVNPKNLPTEEEAEQYEELDKDEKQKRLVHDRSLLLHSQDRIISTQFESCGARRCFPCLDLPSRKCKYTIRIISVPEIDLCISNMDLKLFRVMARGNGLKIWEFEDTPLLPTYLLCIVLATKNVYKSIEDSIAIPIFERKICDPQACLTSSKNTQILPLRMIVPPEKYNEGVYALSMAKEIIHILYSYFGMDIQLSKLDSITLPYFRSGAMENHGCLVFRENELVPKDLPQVTTVQHFLNLISSANIWAHEFSHLCFGNTITALNWGELWTNESFATYFSYFVLDKIRPEWLIWARFLTYNVKIVQEIDWVAWSPKFYQHCQNQPNDRTCYDLVPFAKNKSVVMPRHFFLTNKHIDSMFDPITYAKGAALLRMLEYAIGPERFHQTIHLFAHSCSEKGGTFKRFQECLDQVCGGAAVLTNIHGRPEIFSFLYSQIMEAYWTEPGFPLLKVSYVRETLTVKISIIQDKKKKDEKEKTEIWNIPLLSTTMKLKKDFILMKNVKHFSLQFETKQEVAEFLKINRDGAGYYVTLYDHESYYILTAIYSTPEHFRYFSRLDKIHMLNDVFFNLRRQFIDFKDALVVFFAYHQYETDPMVLFYFLQTLKEVRMYYKLYPKMKQVCEGLLTQFVTRLTSLSSKSTSSFTTLLHEEAKSIVQKSKEEKKKLEEELLILNLPTTEEKKKENVIVLVLDPNEKQTKILEQKEGEYYNFQIEKKKFLDLLTQSLTWSKKVHTTSESNPEEIVETFTIRQQDKFPQTFNTQYEKDIERFPFHPQLTVNAAKMETKYIPQQVAEETFQIQQNNHYSTYLTPFQIHSILLSIYPSIQTHEIFTKWKQIMSDLNYKKKFFFIEQALQEDK